jgi:hypothetical protein
MVPSPAQKWPWIAGGALLVAGVAAAVWLAPSQPAAPAVAELLSARDTLGFVALDHLDALARSGLANAERFRKASGTGVLATWLQHATDPTTRTAKLGFDPATAAGWQSVGLDAEAGTALVLDGRIQGPAGLPMPVLLARTIDAGKLDPWLAARGLKLETNAGSIGKVTFDGQDGAWVRDRGWTAAATVEVQKAQGLAAMLAADGPKLAADPSFQAAMGDVPGGGRVVAYASVGAIQQFSGPWLTGALGSFGGAAEAAGEHVASLFRSSSAWLTTSTGNADKAAVGARVVASGPGLTALRQILVPDGPGPQFARWIPKQGWLAVRASLNLKHLFEGVIGLLPPEAASARLAVAGARTALSLSGASWEDLARAVTGHAVVAVNHEKWTQDALAGKVGMPEWFALVQVRDEAAADHLIGKAKPVLEHLGTLVTVVRKGGFVVFAADAATVARALALTEAQSCAGTAAAAMLDGPVAFAFVADTGSLLRMRDEAVQAAHANADLVVALKALDLSALSGEPYATVRLAVDDRGLILAASRSLVAGAAALVPAIAAFGLRFPAN